MEYPEATPLDFAIVGCLNFSMAMLVAPVVTIFARKHGPRSPMLVGVFLQAAGYVSASFARRVWQLYLSQGALVGLGVGFIYIPSTVVLSQWFTKRRSLANGISTAGSGIGGLMFSFATSALVANLSVSWSLRTTGIITGVMNLTAAVLIRHRNDVIQPYQKALDVTLLRRYDVLLLLGWAFIVMLGFITLFFSLPDFTRSINLTNSQAAGLSAFLNLGVATGRPLTGILSDRFGRMEVAGLLTLACATTVFAIWLPANSYGVTILFAIISGAVLGIFWVVGYPGMFANETY